jgi:plastocyanin
VRVLLVILAFAVVTAPADGARRCKGKRCHLVAVVKKKRAGARWASFRPPVFQTAAPAPGAPVSDPAAPSSPGGSTGPSAPPPPPPPPPDPSTDPHRLQVRADEFTLVRSQPAVAVGDVIVEFTTVDAEDPHDLVIFRADGAGEPFRFDELGPGKTASAVVPFAAGTYRLICSLPEHESRGMTATIVAE